MTGSESFKFDVRIRERMLRKGTLSEADVGKHLEGLSDVAAQGEDLVLRQPALHRHDEGARKSVPPAPRSVPPPMSAPPSAASEGEGGADIDDDDWGENP
jgi:hypothetical protein